MNRFGKKICFCIIQALCLTPSAFGVTRYIVSDLGSVQGSQAYYPRAMNFYGQTVGFHNNRAGGQNKAFLAGKGLGMLDMGAPPGTRMVIANGINWVGQVVGAYVNSAGEQHAYIWHAGEGFTTIPMAEGSTEMVANSVNSWGGQVVGTAGPFSKAFIWDCYWGFLNVFGPEGTFSTAIAINEYGQVTGDVVQGTASDAYVWSGKGGMVRLPRNNPAGIHVGLDIDDLGNVVGYGSDLSLTRQEAMIWQPSGDQYRLRLIGGLPLASSSRATNINYLGDVVGFSTLPGGNRAFIWNEQDGIRDLNTLTVDSPGWVLKEVWGINERGQITGVGENQLQQIRGFILNPVER